MCISLAGGGGGGGGQSTKYRRSLMGETEDNLNTGVKIKYGYIPCRGGGGGGTIYIIP